MSHPTVVKVLIVDDDALVRAGLTMMLDGVAGIRVVGEAADGTEVARLVSEHAPDVVLMDLRMPKLDGINATRRLRARPGAPEVIVLTTFDSDANVVRALRAGAGGFLLKDTPPQRIVEAVLRVAAGDPILSPQIVRRLMDQVAERAGASEQAARALATLSPRERDVVTAIARGCTNAEIAEALTLGLATVKAHVSHIMTKLELGNRTQIALLAHEAGID
jgi:DNA-binding NarL/FixJ family response regulator